MYNYVGNKNNCLKHKMLNTGNNMVTQQLLGLRGQINKGSVELTNGVSDLRKGLLLGADPSMRNGGTLAKMARDNTQRPESIRDLANNGMDVEYFSGEPEYNAPHPWERLVKPIGPHIPAPSIGELVLLHKPDNGNNKTIRMENSMMNQGNPLTILNPAQWNMELAKWQLCLFKDERAKYDQLTPRDVFKNWTIDGVVEKDNSTGSTMPSTQRNKRLVILTRGFAKIDPYWTNVEAGTVCLMIIKKYDNYDGNYVLNTYANSNNNTSNIEQVEKPPNFNPFQIGFYSLKHGGQLSWDALKYNFTDKDNFTYERTDSLVIRVGVIHDPRGQGQSDNSYMHKDNKNTGSGRAFLNSNENLSMRADKQYHIILDCDDGIMPY
jgi:hypothetical protein